jgi:hypothetical protein
MIPYLIASTQLLVACYNFCSVADSIFFMFLSLSNFYYEQIVMDSSNLEEPYDDESDVEDSEADDGLNDEFEGVLKQVQKDSCHQQTDVRRGNKRSAGNVFKFPQQINRSSRSKKGKLNDGSIDSIKRKYKDDRSIIADIENLSFCCARGGELGCLKRMFTVSETTDYTKAVKYIRDIQVKYICIHMIHMINVCSTSVLIQYLRVYRAIYNTRLLKSTMTLY